jgi:DNA modification methylase
VTVRLLAGCPPGGTVLDPFGGSGTTGLVADREHRNAILIDLDARNAPMATARISAEAPLFADVQT